MSQSKQISMKKVLFLILASFAFTFSYAQEKISTYHSSYFDKEYEILAAFDNQKLNLYIEVAGEYESEYVLFGVEGNDEIQKFSSALETVKQKYVEWSSVAKQNGVKSFDKNFDVEFPNIIIAWRGVDWRFDFYNNLRPRFVVTDSGQCVAVMTGKATASDNQYIDQKYYFALSSVSDFDELIAKIQIDKLLSHFNQKSNIDTLFQ